MTCDDVASGAPWSSTNEQGNALHDGRDNGHAGHAGPVTDTIQRLRSARFASHVVFMANGMVLGSWAPRIPEVKAELGLSDGVLGVCLLALAVGALLTMPMTGGWAGRIGSATATRVTAIAFFVLAATIGLASGAVTLFVALLLTGAAMGALDVAMNAQAVTVERAYGRSLMSGIHATFSLGALFGAGIGAAGAAWRVDLFWQLAVLSGSLLVVVLVLSRAMLADPSGEAQEPGPLLVRPRGPQVALAAAAFAVLLCEGSAVDWSAVYLRDGLDAGVAAGAAFAAFRATMTIGRLVGDRVLGRRPRRVVIRQFTLIAAAGMALGLTVAELTDGTVAVVAAVAGFGVLGAGISLTFPALLAEAGAGSARPAEAIGAVATGGYTGFLVGPPLIGAVAETAGLPVAMWLIPLLAAGAALTVSGRGHSNSEPDARNAT